MTLRASEKSDKNMSKIMIFDEFLKGLIKHINSEAVIACNGLTSRSQPIQKTPYIDMRHSRYVVYL